MSKANKSVILIVDDQPSNVFALEQVLQASDRVFVTATSGPDALQITLNRNVDLIILDVQMPGMDGLEVAQILKSNKRTRDIPIIFATAISKEHKVVMKAYGEGAVDFLYKPLDPDIVKAKVAVLLKLQMQKKELVDKNTALHKNALLINNSADILGIIDAATLKIEEVNKALTAILGYATEEIRGTSLLLYLIIESRRTIEEQIKSGRSQLFFETGVYCRNRSVKWLQWKVAVKEGKWFFNARDITEVKEVQKIRNYLATVVKQSNDAIYIYNKEERIISWNEGAEKIYGYTEDEALKMSIWHIIPEFLQDEMSEKINSITERKAIHDFPTTRITKKGKLIDVLFSAAIINESGGEQRSIAITERDITERKKAEDEIRLLNENLERKVEIKTRELRMMNLDLEKRAAELQASNIELERFAFVASHDLQEPLRMVSGFLSLLDLETEGKLEKESKDYIRFALDGTQRMKNLIQALLEYSRIGGGEQPLVDVDCSKLVENTVKLLHPVIQENQARLSVGPLPVVRGVESHLQQVFQNLISNALKYHNHQKPEIEISCTDSAENWQFSVKDNGIGFDPKYADRIFVIFQRLHDKSEYSGTGIGLSICKKIVERAGGKIWAESLPGKGSMFYFTIPKNHH